MGMAWSEMRQVPNEYNDQLKAIDEKLLTLYQERIVLTGGRRFFPPNEVMEEWADELGMEPASIRWFMHQLQGRVNYAAPSREPGGLLAVLPIMKWTVVDGIEYRITHAMQHQNASIVHLEINGPESLDPHLNLRPRLLLEVAGEQPYDVRPTGSSGGGRQAQMRFLITPPLPDDLHVIRLSLIPYMDPAEIAPKEMILNQEVNFV